MAHRSAQRLLVALDFSINSLNAWHQAAELACMTGGSVEAVHVQAPALTRNGSRTKRAALAALRKRVGDLARLHVITGSPANTILKLTRSMRPDIVLMGTEGRTGLRRLLLGSTAEAVVRSSPVPVLTLRHRARHINSILVPVSLTHYAITGIAQTAKLAEQLGARLELFHIARDLDQGGDPAEVFKGVIRKLPKAIRNDCSVRVDYSEHEPADVVIANENRHDLIAIGFHNKDPIRDWVMGTTAERILERSSIPVLTCPYLELGSRERWRLVRPLMSGQE